VYANRRLPEVLGFSVEEIQAMGDRFLAVFTHADDYPRLLQAMGQVAAAADHDIVEVEYRILDPGGNWHWFYDRATIFTRDPDGSVREVLGSSQDVTERKLAQEKLTEREYFIKQVADATPDGLYVYDLHLGRSVYNNRQIYQMLGYSYEAFHALGTSTTQTITHPEDLPRRLAHFDGWPTWPTARWPTSNTGCAPRRRVAVGAQPRQRIQTHGHRGALAVLGIVQDVTERKKGRPGTGLQRPPHRADAGQLPPGAHRHQPRGNRARMHRLGPAEPGHPRQRAARRQHAGPVSQSGPVPARSHERQQGYLPLRRRGGRGKKYFQNYYFYDPGQACAVGFSIDVTEQKEAEEQLADSRQFIEQITQAVPQIIYVFDLIEGRNLYINREVYASLGYSQAQVAGMGDGILAK
jgi:PAS domain S-box-containing protein